MRFVFFFLFLLFCGCGTELETTRQRSLLVSAAPNISSSRNRIKIIAIDVGQGDATLIIGEDGQGILIDTGLPQVASRVIKIIEEQKIKVSHIFLSHPDLDHTGGLEAILEYLKQQSITPIVFNEQTTPFGKNFSIGSATLEVQASQGHVGDHILTEEEKLESNHWSTALLLHYKNFDYLTAGDLPGGGGNPPYETPDLESSLAPKVGDIDILHISHHGSHTATNDFFLSMLKPEAAIISTGDHNEYFHPHISVIDRLLKANVAVYQTERGWLNQNGPSVFNDSICIQSDGETYSIKPYAIDKCGATH